MVKIRRGEHETMVSMASYENIFKPLGYTLVENKKAKIVLIEEPIKEKNETVKSVSDKRKKKQEEK